MNEIKIVEKPEWVSYEEIHEILYVAHEINRTNGFVMTTSNLTGKQIEERIGKQGKCWVALDNNKIVGTLSVRMIHRSSWYINGEIPDYILAGVHPMYQGKNINAQLTKKAFEYVQKRGFSLIELDTAENNKHAIEIYKHYGFRLVGYEAITGVDHYSVVMVKWLGNCPYSELQCKWRYNLRRFLVRVRYRIGGKKRFGI